MAPDPVISALLKQTSKKLGIDNISGPELSKPKTWKVVAGGKSGGLLVRDGKLLASAELPDRLAKGALVEEIQLVGERLHFFRLTGEGPGEGWISTKQKGADLLVPADGEGLMEDEWVYSPEQADKDYLSCAKKMWESEGRGTFSTVVEATAAKANAGQVHICCLSCSEAGHLTPTLRAARGLAARPGVWRVTVVTNQYGADRARGWLEASPDDTGKIQVVGYKDGWDAEIQDLSNMYSQAEDGKLFGLQNDAMSVTALECVQSIHQGEDRPSVYVADIGSFGYEVILGKLDPAPKKITSVPLVVFATPMCAKSEVPVLFHCFELPPLLDQIKALTPRPPQLFLTGIIADEVKPTALPPELEAFLNQSDLPVVYVSMGSQGIFGRDQLRRVVAGLRAPGEWRVIWSLRENQQRLLPGGGPESLGADFYVSKWLPQAELLLHPKVKLFMSHCGWGATCEAITSQKPVLALPLFADQNMNAFFLELFGMAKVVGMDKMNRLDQKSVTGRFFTMMSFWHDPKTMRLRDCFSAKGLHTDIQMMLSEAAYRHGAAATKRVNDAHKGGLGYLAEVIECHARGQPLPAPGAQAAASP